MLGDNKSIQKQEVIGERRSNSRLMSGFERAGVGPLYINLSLSSATAIFSKSETTHETGPAGVVGNFSEWRRADSALENKGGPSGAGFVKQ